MYFIGYDIGSSSIKAALVHSETGESIDVVSEPKKELGMTALEHGWAEQHPDIWWEHVCTATKSLLSRNEIDPETIAGIGISYQMHGLVAVNEKGIPLREAIIWCDSRAVEIGQKAFEELGKERCSNHLLNSPANFTASKLKWVKDNEPDVYENIHKIMLPGDYIAFKLSGTMNTTISGLSEGIFWDFENGNVASWLLEYYGLDKNHLPDITATFSEQAQVSTNGALESGLSAGTPVLYRAGDQPNNALSLNVFSPGEVAATGGTSGVVYAITQDLSVKESFRVNNFAHVNYSESEVRIGKLLCINGAGILYRWLLNNLDVSSYEEMNNLAASVPIGSEGLIVLPFGNGAERMLNNRNLGARFINLSLNNHTKAHLCRAALEGIAFSFAYGTEILKSDGTSIDIIRAGNDNLFRSDIFSKTIASLIDRKIEIYNTTGAIGAARACILHKGTFEDFGRQILNNDYIMTYEPIKEERAYTEAYENWKKELELILKN